MNIKFYTIDSTGIVHNFIDNNAYRHIANIIMFHKNRVRRYNSEL